MLVEVTPRPDRTIDLRGRRPIGPAEGDIASASPGPLLQPEQFYTSWLGVQWKSLRGRRGVLMPPTAPGVPPPPRCPPLPLDGP
jgi:hypothetical protein